MLFVGAGIQIVKGLVEKILNKKNLKRLQELNQADIFDLVPIEKQTTAKILLKQTKHQYLIFNNADRSDLSNTEKEIINLMEKNISEKKEELENKKATQLDIANLLLTIQKLSHETADEIFNLNERFEKFSNGQKLNYDSFEKKQKNINQKNARFNFFLLIYNVALTGLFTYILIID